MRLFVLLAFGILPIYYHCWKAVLQNIDELEVEDLFLLFNLIGTARKIHPGRVSLRAPVQEQLSACVFQLREQGIQCTNCMVVREASHLVPAVGEKLSAVQVQVVHRFTKHLGLTQERFT